MRQFFKNVFSSLLGTLLALFIAFVVFIVFIAALVTSNEDETASISEHSIIQLQLNYAIPERTLKSPFSGNLFDIGKNKALGLNDILASIKKAKDDSKVSGLFLDLSSVPAGFATLEEIRNALIDFKTSRKFIYAYGEVMTQSGYYLASVANKIYVYPEGLLEFRGFQSQTVFIKGALEKLEIEPQIIKVGTYKSAVEPLFLDKMSEPNREQVTAYVGSLYDHFLSSIATSRKIAKDTLFQIANKLLVQTPQDAVTYHLTDGVRYYDEVVEELKKVSGVEKGKDLNLVSLDKYHTVVDENTEPTSSKNRIALIYANGDINSGEGDDENIGSERISAAIKKARLDTKINAIVLRVNSPGGSALASDVIWREVSLATASKPLIVSMGNVAASGGYYIACAANKIFAEPNTITGSIGVFGVLPNALKFFNNKLGVTFDGVKTGEFADLGSINRPLSPAERAIIQNNVNNTYKTFTEKVAKGRKMSVKKVDSIGQGRVWSGTDAKRLGLVDELGNLDDALAAAAKMAKISEYKILTYPSLKDPIDELLNDFGSSAKTWMLKQELGEQYAIYQQVKQLMLLKGVQARMEYDINIE